MLKQQWIVLSGLRNLRIASRDGAPSNEYRIQQSSVEFRAIKAVEFGAINGNGDPFSTSMGQWRVLDENEIQLHFALRTPVADWLDKNLYKAAATQ